MSPILIAEQLGVGGVFGAIVGYTARKVTKLLAVLLGLFFILIQVLAHYNLLTVHWENVEAWWSVGASSDVAATPVNELVNLFMTNLPFGGAFLVGFAWGFRAG